MESEGEPSLFCAIKVGVFAKKLTMTRPDVL